MGGGKGGTSTSTVSIPPEVLARYNAVNARAETAASGSFQPYTGQFVAGMTPTQQAGVAGTNAAANLAQPFYQAGTDLTMQGAQSVGPLTQQQIGYYQDPYVKSVVDPTRQALEQEQGQQRTQQQAQAIKSGAFGGDRAGLERANLARQQTLGMSQAINPLYSQAYQSGVQTAAGQQGVISADLQRKLAAGQQVAGLGTGAQGAALQGAQQQLAAGTAEQQTQQADLTAQYQQFLQQQGFPYQQAQFLANIAMGTGALSGSTTTTQQPTGFLSDRRLKHDVHEIGKTHDGQPIYSYKYNGDNKTQIGLMAQDVEKKHPEAVGVMGGYKTVDYGKATENSERPERAAGGVIPNSMGGGVWHPDAYAGGGLVDGEDMKAILQAQQAGFGPWGGGGVYGGAGAGSPGSKSPGIVPQASLPVPKLITAGQAPARQASGLSQAASTGSNIASTGRAAVDFKNWVSGLGKDKPGAAPEAKTSAPASTGSGKADLPAVNAKPTSYESGESGFHVPDGMQPEVTPPDATPDLEGFFAQGGVIPFRHHRAGGGTNPYEVSDDMSYIPKSVLQEGEQEADQAAGQFKKNAGQGGGGGGHGGSGLGDLASLASLGKTAYSLGSSAMEYLPMLFALKDGGVVPRHGYALDGAVDSTSDQPDYDPRSDMPSENAREAAYKPDDGDVYSRLHPEFGPRFKEAIRLANEAGIPVKPGSTVRSTEEQARLRADKEAGTRGAYQSLPVALPGHSAHNYAIAGDVAGLKPEHYGKFGDIVRSQGLTYGGDWKGGNFDPVHVQYGVGGFGQLKDAPRDENGHVILPEGFGTGKGVVPLRDVPDISNKVADSSGSIGRGSTLGDVFSKMTPESIPSNENFWIPALSGLGSMLASNRPTLLGAVGEGLVGGVSGYQTMQKQHAEMAKGVMDLIKDRFVTGTDKTGNTTFYDKVLGKFVDPSHVQGVGASMLSNLGINPKAYGFGSETLGASGASTSPRTIAGGPSAPAAAAPAPAVTETAAPAPTGEVKTEAATPINKDTLFGKSESELISIAKQRPDLFPGLTGDRDPRALQAEINQHKRLVEELSARGQPQQAATENQLASDKQKRLDEYLKQAVDFQYKQNEKVADAAAKTYGDYKTDVDKRAANYSSHELKLKRLADINADFQSGAMAAGQSKLLSYLKGTPLERLLPSNWADQPGQYGEAYKLALAEALQAMSEDKLVRAPKIGAEKELAKVPSPDSDPAAVYSILGSSWGDLLKQKQMDADFAKAPPGTNPGDFAREWSKRNDPTKFYRDAFNQITPHPSISSKAIQSLQETYRSPQTGETFTPAPRRGVTEGAPAATAAPAVPSGNTIGEERQFKQGVGVWNGTTWVPKGR